MYVVNGMIFRLKKRRKERRKEINNVHNLFKKHTTWILAFQLR